MLAKQIPLVDLRAWNIAWKGKNGTTKPTMKIEWYMAEYLTKNPHFYCDHKRMLCRAKGSFNG